MASDASDQMGPFSSKHLLVWGIMEMLLDNRLDIISFDREKAIE